MADLEEFVVVETPPELKKHHDDETETAPTESSPAPEDKVVITDETTTTTEETTTEETTPKETTPEETTPKETTPEETTPKETTPEETTPELVTDETTVEDKQEEPPVVDESAKEDEVKPTEEQEEPPKTEEPSTEDQSTEEPKDETTTSDEQPKETTNDEDQTVTNTDTEELPKADEPAKETNEIEPTPKHRAPIAISGKQLKQLLTGNELLKAKKGTKVYPRLYYITGDLLRFVWNSKRKPQAKSQIALSQIIDVIPGRKSTTFQLYRGTQEDDVCFTIVYTEGGVQKTLDLISHSPEDASLWCNGLLALTGNGVSENTAELRKKWLRTLFDEADSNGDGTLDLKEVIKMLKRLNLGISQKKLKRKFQEADSNGNSDNKLDFDEFCRMFADFSERPELRAIFNLYATADNGTYMTVDDLLNFVHTEQDSDSATVEYCESVIDRYEPSEKGLKQHLLSIDGFVQYLVSDDNDIFNRDHSKVYQDMTHPLAHYFIASSHNTYLLEDQLSGPSSIDAYISALKRGCRCVELDCWDGEDNEPIVYHGHTLTSKIFFKDCVQAIKDHAFTASSYPLILSIENHCSVAQQHVMADYLSDILGDMLHKEERDESLGKLPSPEDLKNKVLIKAKKLQKEHEDKEDDDGEVSDEDEGAEIDKEEVEKVKPKAAVVDNPDDIPDGPVEPVATQQTEVRKVVRDRSDTVKEKEDVQKPSAKRKLSSKLSKCVNYVQSVHFKGFDESTTAPFFHMSSFGESSAFKHSDTKAFSYINYNKIHLSRTYPAGRRVDSSNYEPIDLWNCGCQIVALNYQTPGKAMDYNIGKFQQNGGCGYILKPEVMREDYSHFNHKDKAATDGVTPKIVTIRIISGQRLPKPEGGSKDGEIIDPYVIVKVTGIPTDKREYRTKHIDDNGFNPVWNETYSQLVTFPELCIIRFCVMDYDTLSQDDFIGQYTLPLTSMSTGYRTIKLRSANWDVIEGATLFVEVRIQDWVGPTPKTKDKLRGLKLMKARQYPVFKPVSFPTLDTIFRNAKLTAHSATDIREDYIFQLLLFKDTCGKASINDCMEAISSKAHSARVQLKLVPIATGGSHIYQIEVAGDNTTPQQTGVNGSLMTLMNNFNRLNHTISSVLNLSDKIAEELNEFYTLSLKHQNDYYNHLDQPAQQKKQTQLRAAYSSNLRYLKNLSSELNETRKDVTRVLDKIPRCAEKFGIQIYVAPEPTTEETKTTTTTTTTEEITTTTTTEKTETEETTETDTTEETKTEETATDETKTEETTTEETKTEETTTEETKTEETATDETKIKVVEDQPKDEGTDC